VRHARDGLGDEFSGASERLVRLFVDGQLHAPVGDRFPAEVAQRTWSWPMSRPTAYAAVGGPQFVQRLEDGDTAERSQAGRRCRPSLRIPRRVGHAATVPTANAVFARKSDRKLVAESID
jgi:hypothetical protein